QTNVGYDRVVHELLVSQNNNMGFGGVGRNGQPAGSAAAFFFANENKPENLAGSVSRVFLGVKLECAQCHAHPFAKWTREQFWEFAAFFVGTQPSFNRFNPDGTAPKNIPASTAREITIPGTGKVVKAKYLTGDEPKWKAN